MKLTVIGFYLILRVYQSKLEDYDENLHLQCTRIQIATFTRQLHVNDVTFEFS